MSFHGAVSFGGYTLCCTPDHNNNKAGFKVLLSISPGIISFFFFASNLPVCLLPDWVRFTKNIQSKVPLLYRSVHFNVCVRIMSMPFFLTPLSSKITSIYKRVFHQSDKFLCKNVLINACLYFTCTFPPNHFDRVGIDALRKWLLCLGQQSDICSFECVGWWKVRLQAFMSLLPFGKLPKLVTSPLMARLHTPFFVTRHQQSMVVFFSFNKFKLWCFTFIIMVQFLVILKMYSNIKTEMYWQKFWRLNSSMYRWEWGSRRDLENMRSTKGGNSNWLRPGLLQHGPQPFHMGCELYHNPL